MIEIQGETEFLTRILTKHGALEHQKTVLALRIAESNDEVLGRAVRKIVWLMTGVILVYWAGSAVAFSVPGVILTLSSKVLGVLFIGSAISLAAFSMYRVRIRQRLRKEIEKCRQMLESALALTANFNAAVILNPDRTDSLQCSRCRRELLGMELLAIQEENSPKMRNPVCLTGASDPGM